MFCFGDGDKQDKYVKTTLQETLELFIQEMRAVEAVIANSQWLTKELHLAKEKLL